MPGVEVFFRHEREHRLLVVLRGDGLDARLGDTDPQQTGVPPLAPSALAPEAKHTADLVVELDAQIRAVLADDPKANVVLLRGFDTHRELPGFEERYGLRSAAIAIYPMYRGIARLLGMDVLGRPADLAEQLEILRDAWNDYDYFFLHHKYTDSAGEDGDRAPEMGTTASSFSMCRDLAAAVAVFAGGVGVLVVQEEVVVVVPCVAQDLELLGEVGGPPEHVHAEQARDAAVHRVDRDRRGAQPEAGRRSPGSSRWVSKPRNSTTLAFGLVGEHAPHLRVDLGDEVGGALRLGVERLGRERRARRCAAGRCRRGGGRGPAPRSTTSTPVLALVPEEHLDAGHATRRPGACRRRPAPRGRGCARRAGR